MYWLWLPALLCSSVCVSQNTVIGVKRFASKHKPKLGSMQEQVDVEHRTYEDRGKAKVFFPRQGICKQEVADVTLMAVIPQSGAMPADEVGGSFFADCTRVKPLP